MSLTPICETSYHPLSEISKEFEFQDQSSDFLSPKRRENAFSLSETFVSLNRAFPQVETHIQQYRTSEKPKVINANQMPSIKQPHRDKPSQKSVRKQLSSFLLDIPPFLIAAIWAAAILLSMPSPWRL